MARRLHVERQEDEATLKEYYLSEKDMQNRTRLQALWQLRRGRTIVEVAELDSGLGCLVSPGRFGGGALQHRHGGHSGKQSWLSDDQMDELKAAASAGKMHCIQDGVQWVQEKHGVTYTYWGMCGVFGRLGLRKVPRPRNPQASVEQQEAWKKGGSVPS